MRHPLPILLCLLPLQLLPAEDVTLVASATRDSNNYFVPGYSETITLNAGDTARLEGFFPSVGIPADYLYFEVVIGSATFLRRSGSYSDPLVLAGPATVRLQMTQGNGFATFSITRAGLASPPAAIPQEAGTTWEVILESSSDLINWTPANPGQYGGIEPKRFFRTRMVKTSDP